MKEILILILKLMDFMFLIWVIKKKYRWGSKRIMSGKEIGWVLINLGIEVNSRVGMSKGCGWENSKRERSIFN